MPNVSVGVQTSATPRQVWQFIEDMDNWAPFLTGYQSHRQIDSRHSVWTVKGDLAGLTRVAELNVTITAWDEPERVAFELEGVDEPFTGFGEFRIIEGGGAASSAPRRNFLLRVRDWIARRILSGIFAKRQRSDQALQGCVQSDLQCSLTIEAGGGSGPIMNLLLAPMLPTIADDMAREIVNALEQRAAAVIG